MLSARMTVQDGRRVHRILRPGQTGPDALDAVALADRVRARRDLDFGWTRSHPGRFVRRHPHAWRDARAYRRRSRRECDLLFDRGSSGRAAFRIRNRSARSEEIILYHGGGLSRGDGGDRILVELREL